METNSLKLNDLLLDQIELYRRHAADGDGASKDDRVIEDLVDLGLALHQRIRDCHTRIADQACARSDSYFFEPDEAKYLRSLYETWAQGTAELLKKIDHRDPAGVQFVKSIELRSYHKWVVVETAQSDESIREKVEAALRGEAKPLREAFDAFRRRRFGSSAR